MMGTGRVATAQQGENRLLIVIPIRVRERLLGEARIARWDRLLIQQKAGHL